MTRDELLAQVSAMPAGSLLPVGWIADRLAELEVTIAEDPELLDVADLARRWKRSRSAVRAMLEGGDVIGAYKHGRRWLIRRGDVEAFEAQQAEQHAPVSSSKVRRGRLDLRALAVGGGANAPTR